MKWTVLSDNRTNNPALATEHGLSILLETDRHRILLDTGASDLFIRNAQVLGIELSTVDYVFISHGHSDHAGGLLHFMQVNDHAHVIVSPQAMSGRFYSRRLSHHSITAEWPVLPPDRLLTVSQSGEVTDGIYVIANIPQIHPVPKGNRHLFVQNADGAYRPDDFRHELALYVDGFLFTGCAHSGLENILAACPWPVHTVMGGFHLLDGYESDTELTDLAQRLNTDYPDVSFYTGHCTGEHAFEVLKRQMGAHLQTFRLFTVSGF